MVACLTDAPQPPLERARGDLAIGFRRRRGATVLELLRQQGCLKARLPRVVDPGWREAIALNNSGGVAGGDDLATSLHLGPDSAVVFTTASAERIYRARAGDPPARIRNTVTLADGARAEWLPQETILFDGARLTRALDIVLQAGSSLLGVETLVFGRVAMGEMLLQADVRDAIRICRDGRLILHEQLLLPDRPARALQRRATAAGARASATLFWVAPGAGAALQPVRDVLAEHGTVHAGASAWDGMLVVRMLAREPAAMRIAVAALLHVLRAGRMLPRVWSC